MKPASAPDVPGNTEFERFDNAVRKVVTVSKEDLLKAEAKWKPARARKKRRNGASPTGELLQPSFNFDCFGLGFRATCFDGDLHSTFHRIFEGNLDSE